MVRKVVRKSSSKAGKAVGATARKAVNQAAKKPTNTTAGKPTKPIKRTERTKTTKATNATGTAKAASAGGKTASRRRQGPIDLYYWPTPNGWKISIMLEETGLPYTIIPVNISRGDQFKPDFLAISPNNRMPAIVDPDGPGGRPISVFESGAILQYLGRKTGQFYPREERARVEVEQWLFWQMGGLGPMAGQANHFRHYAPEKVPYGIARYTNEVNRLYGVMNTRLADRGFLAGAYSIADMACIGWIKPHARHGQDLNDFPHLKRWFETMMARPAVKAGIGIRVEEASQVNMQDPQVLAVLFGQRARR